MSDRLLFFATPLAIAVILTTLCIQISEAAGSLLVNAFAIFAALLLNLLLLIHGLLKRYSDPVAHAMPRRLLKELYANIAYAVLVSLLALVPLIAIAFLSEGRGKLAVSGVIFFLVGNFLLTLLMILKRVHILLKREYEQPGT